MKSDLNEKDLRFDLQLFAEGGGGGEGGEGGDSGGEGGDGFPYPYMAQFPDEYKKDEYFKPYKTLGELAKSHRGLREKVNSIPAAPDKAEGYEFPAPEGEKDYKPDQKTESWFRDTAFHLRLSKDHAEKLYVEYNKMVSEQLKEREKAEVDAAKKHDEFIHAEWGSEFDANMKFAEKAVTDLGGEELENLLVERGIRDHPVILKALKQIGFEHSDDTLKTGSVSGKSGGQTLNDEYPSMKDLPDKR